MSKAVVAVYHKVGAQAYRTMDESRVWFFSLYSNNGISEDQSLYAAKHSGRNQIVGFNRSVISNLVEYQ